MHFSDFGSVESYLNSLINYEHDFPLGGNRGWPKLEPVQAALCRLDLPFRLPNCIHVAGTKGKGSCVGFLEALFASRNGVLSFTSPHLLSVKERVRWNGEHLADEMWQAGFAEIAECIPAEPAIRLTYFESVFVFFVWAARRLKPQISVVEVGLGGRWDATNVLQDTTAVLMPVDYDHTHVLGDTLEKIAGEKAGIVKPGSTVVISRQFPEVLRVFDDVIQAQTARAYRFGDDFRWVPTRDVPERGFRYEDARGSIDSLELAATGTHQRDNAATAIFVARQVDPTVSADEVRQRLATCVIPGRQQLLTGSPDVLLDVAHNPVSFAALADTLRAGYLNRRVFAIVGLMRDKDARGCLAQIRDLVDEMAFVPLNSPRTANPESLVEIARALGIRAEVAASADQAFERLHEGRSHDLGLVVGSFYLAGDYLAWRSRAGIA